MYIYMNIYIQILLCALCMYYIHIKIYTHMIHIHIFSIDANMLMVAFFNPLPPDLKDFNVVFDLHNIAVQNSFWAVKPSV